MPPTPMPSQGFLRTCQSKYPPARPVASMMARAPEKMWTEARE